MELFQAEIKILIVLWENQIIGTLNPDFKRIEFDAFKNEAGAVTCYIMISLFFGEFQRRDFIRA